MKDFYGFMIGKLLGDGTIVKQSGRAPRFSMLHRIEDKPYLEICHRFLIDYIPLSPLIYKKTIPKAYIEKYFNHLSLAIWYQDDGHLKINKGRARKVILSTECFTDIEILFLQNLIRDKYSLYFHIDKQRRLILYNTKEVMYFLNLIRPFLFPGMERKDHMVSIINTSVNKKRTTISLPIVVSSRKPTSYINKLLHHTEVIQHSIKNNNFYMRYYPLLRTHSENYKYQINIDGQTVARMKEIKDKTGLTFNEIALVCLLIERKKKIAQDV